MDKLRSRQNGCTLTCNKAPCVSIPYSCFSLSQHLQGVWVNPGAGAEDPRELGGDDGDDLLRGEGSRRGHQGAAGAHHQQQTQDELPPGHLYLPGGAHPAQQDGAPLAQHHPACLWWQWRGKKDQYNLTYELRLNSMLKPMDSFGMWWNSNEIIFLHWIIIL